MRTPPPVLPAGQEDSPGYEKSWLDRQGPDAMLWVRSAPYGVVTGAMALGGMTLVPVPGGLPVMLLLAILVGYLSTLGAVKLGTGAGAVAKSFTLPSGNSTPYEQTFSYQEAMIMRGQVDAALESYEAIIAEQPGLVSARERAAEHYARGNRNPKRAAELFCEIRRIPGVPTRDTLYASSRLVDLYEGPLADPGRALVELRRIIEQHPTTALADHAKTALPALKARLESTRTGLEADQSKAPPRR